LLAFVSSRYVYLLQQLCKALARADIHEQAMKSLLQSVQTALAGVKCVEQEVSKSLTNVSA